MENINIYKVSPENDSMMNDVKFIRTEVFIKEQNVSEEHEWDNAIADNYILYLEQKPIATLRTRIIGEKIKIERFAVLKEYRGKHFGKILLEFLLNKLKDKSFTIYLNSQTHALGFYQKYGFEPEGDLFYEANIPHYTMSYKNH